ncbi:cytochrome c biogenesis CcdA family protein [Peribacillus frigoritolerans]|uniref:cytochrome c biogenesis CcdA family protein n=1 Tax=Peribacillus frigoritolerans TaxID=450367 RepID=UPI0023DA2B49|nr:cytochrome c biogenesis protein CcdA [Peribacillus frigoritolerans]MDF1995864.1 cytochrome c biogenesis protein CcdA [Peribacillus frigoritolerans]
MEDLNIFLSFGAGVLSFISPCCLPLYPAFLSYITGFSVSELKEDSRKLNRKTILHTFFFLIGFSIIFVVLGLSTSFFYALFYEYIDLIRQVGAILIIVFGLIIVGVFQPKFLMIDRKITFKNRPSGYIGSVLIGIGYAAGWNPCVGPILGAVMALGLSTGQGLIYMIAYILGFSIPFFTMSFFIGKSGWIRKYNHNITRFGGYFTIIMGVVLFFDWMTNITSFLVNNVFGGFTGY